jgi:hypothetical protein
MPRLLGEALLKTTVDLAGLDKGLAQADRRIMDTAGTIADVGATMTKAITVPMLGVAAAGTKLATDLDAEMRNIQSVGRQTETELQDLSDLFVDMSRDIDVTVDSAAGLAAGFYDIQGSGFAGEEELQVLRSATKAASAGLTDTAVSSRALTAVLNAYNLRPRSRAVLATCCSGRSTSAWAPSRSWPAACRPSCRRRPRRAFRSTRSRPAWRRCLSRASALPRRR